MLNHLRVLDLCDERGVLAGQMLADLGADVIQIEPPGVSTGRRVAPFFGDAAEAERSVFWTAYTRNKRSVTCDILRPEGRALLRRLLADTDILFESADPGAMAELGLGYEQIRDDFPRLIYASITAFGQTGPKAGYQATDLTIWAAGTPLLMTGDDDRPPVRISVPQAWSHAAADAAGGAMLALHARHATGRGQHIDVSAQASAAQATLGQVLAHSVGAVEPERYAGGVKVRGVGFRGIAEVRDGWIVLTLAPGPAIGHFVNHAVRWLIDEGVIEPEVADEDFVTYPDRLLAGEADPELMPRVSQAMQSHVLGKTKREMLDVSIAYDLLLAPVLDLADLAQSRQLAARDFWRDCDLNDGRRLRLPAAPLQLRVNDEPQRWDDRPPPALGQHNGEVWGELGFSAAEIADLRGQGVI